MPEETSTGNWVQMKLAGKWSNMTHVHPDAVAAEVRWCQDQNKKRGGDVFRIVKVTTTTEVLS